jgi:putative Holliday junction resolvase
MTTSSSSSSSLATGSGPNEDDGIVAAALDEDDGDSSGGGEGQRPPRPPGGYDDDDDARVVASSPSPPLPPPPLRSIGVDYGLVRTGVAATTSGGYSPRPLAILFGYANSSDLSRSIIDLVLSERATEIVLGLPLHKNGTDSEQSAITRRFGEFLAAEARGRCGRDNARVVLWDERYTSREARSRIAAECMARNRRIPSRDELSGELDADAACIILEQYYRDGGWVDAEVVSVEDGSDAAARCDAAYARSAEIAERVRLGMLEEREQRANARREMIDRDRASEEAAAVGGGVDEDFRDKKKKKKKRKKK